MHPTLKKILDFSKKLWRYIVLIEIILIPLIASLLPAIIQTNEAYCGFVLIVMSLYWITECIPYAITSILPVLLFPMFGIMSSKQVASIYFSDIIMLFLGGLVLATCVEQSNLHKRIAFKVIMLFGSNPIFLMLGMMSVTWFLSLWISNTASTAMMLPIVIATCKQLNSLDQNLSNKIHPEAKVTIEMVSNEDNIDQKNKSQLEDSPAAKKLLKGFIIGISYSASIGGCGSLVGTTPNLILKAYYDNNYPDAGLNFFTYMLYSLPAAFIMLIFTWSTLCVIWLPRQAFIFGKKANNQNKKTQLKSFIQREYETLGSVNWEQASVGVLFLLLVVLWITRDLFFVPGWGSLFKKDFTTDTTPAILILILLVIWPKKNLIKGAPYEPLITWKTINETFPWNILLLAGGGLALAEGFEKSELSKFIGKILKDILPEEKEIALLIVLVFSLIGTELISNTSMASIFIPIASSLANSSNIDASYLLVPLTIGSSYAFMLPVSTPPNAIIFGSGYIKLIDLALSGFVLKFIGIAVLFLSTLWLDSIFTDTRQLSNTNSTTIMSQNLTLFAS